MTTSSSAKPAAGTSNRGRRPAGGVTPPLLLPHLMYFICAVQGQSPEGDGMRSSSMQHSCTLMLRSCGHHSTCMQQTEVEWTLAWTTSSHALTQICGALVQPQDNDLDDDGRGSDNCGNSCPKPTFWCSVNNDNDDTGNGANADLTQSCVAFSGLRC
ncbi:hypothetical protein EDB83DRAFT_2319899 [Lactarius deliciosus]|nr:hypothetical protein EDB83DRAFT_2319899 [Lactarius deliciosus]